MTKNIRKVSNIRYASIREMDISNGEGVGVALFVQGCPFNPHCYNCFNPDTWDFNGGKEWTPEIKDKFLELIDRPYIKRVSILGGEPLADENLDDVLDLVTEINKRYNFQKVDSANPCKMGISEAENADKIRLSFPNKTIWIYSGYRWSEIFNDGVYLTRNCAGWKRREIVKKCDVMIDGKYMDSLRDPQLKWRGSSNQHVINIEKSMIKGEIVLWD